MLLVAAGLKWRLRAGDRNASDDRQKDSKAMAQLRHGGVKSVQRVQLINAAPHQHVSARYAPAKRRRAVFTDAASASTSATSLYR